MGLGLANTAQLASLLTEALDEVAPKDGQPLWDSRLAGGELVTPSPFPEGRKLARSRNLDGKPSSLQNPAWHRGQTRLGGGELGGTLVSTVGYLKTKTIPVMGPTRITQLATNTTIGTSTRHDTAAFTVYIPELAERTIVSARLVCGYRTEYAATNSVIGWLLGLKVGTGPTVDFIRNPTAQNTASRNLTDEIDNDVTEQLNRDFGGGASVSVIASAAFATTVAANVNQLTFTLLVTWAFDGNASNTRVQAIRIPLQSMAGPLSAVQQEFGTDGISPVATKQIPALDTYLVEKSKVFRQIYLEFHGHDGAANTTSFTPFVQLDGAAEVARATIDETVVANMMLRDQYDLTGLDTSIAHTVSMRCDLTNRLPCIGAFLVVVYEYDHALTLAANLATYEALIPLGNSLSDSIGQTTGGGVDATGAVAGATAGGATRVVGSFNIQEPGTPTMLQSAIFAMLDFGSAGGNAAVGLKTPQMPAARVYTQVAASSGPTPVILRIDNTAPALVRGDNAIIVDVTGSRNLRYAYALVNYTAGVRVDVDNGNHLVNFAIHSYDAVSVAGTTLEILPEAAGQHPPILGDAFRITAAVIEAQIRVAAQSVIAGFAIGQLSDEIDGGWSLSNHNGNSISIVQGCRHVFGFTNAVDRDSLTDGKIDVRKRRRMVAQASNTLVAFASWSWWITYHSHQFAVAATVLIDGSPAPAGRDVKIFAFTDANGIDTAELVATAKTDASGAYTALVPDNTRGYFASYDNDGRAGRSLLGTPV